MPNSSQEKSRPTGEIAAGQAYIGFSRLSDAQIFHDWLKQANIATELAPKQLKIGRRMQPDSPSVETIELDTANVLFEPSLIGEIVAVLKNQCPVRG